MLQVSLARLNQGHRTIAYPAQEPVLPDRFRGLPVVDAARLMQDRRVKRLPVVNYDGQLVGIVTRSDVLAIFERPDQDIWDEVTKVIIGTEFRLDPADFEVSARSGVVTIEGVVQLRRTALDLVRRVQHAEGVVGVRNRLSFDSEC